MKHRSFFLEEIPEILFFLVLYWNIFTSTSVKRLIPWILDQLITSMFLGIFL